MNEIYESEPIFYHTFSIFYKNRPKCPNPKSLQKGSQQTYGYIKQTYVCTG